MTTLCSVYRCGNGLPLRQPFVCSLHLLSLLWSLSRRRGGGKRATIICTSLQRSRRNLLDRRIKVHDCSCRRKQVERMCTCRRGTRSGLEPMRTQSSTRRHEHSSAHHRHKPVFIQAQVQCQYTINRFLRSRSKLHPPSAVDPLLFAFRIHKVK